MSSPRTCAEFKIEEQVFKLVKQLGELFSSPQENWEFLKENLLFKRTNYRMHFVI